MPRVPLARLLLSAVGGASRPLLATEPELESEPQPEPHEVGAACDVLARRFGARRAKPGGDPEAESPEEFCWWLLQMARRSYQRTSQPAGPPVDPALVARFAELLGDRPGRDDRHGQLHIDAASALRRAAEVRATIAASDELVLLVGDDDAVSLALVLLGCRNLAVVDIDERLLAFLARTGTKLGARIDTVAVDFFAQPLPAHLRRRCRAAVTDPIRSLEGALVFAAFAAAGLVEGGTLFLCDHPDWNADYGAVIAALPELGFTVERVEEDLHAYPLSADVFPRLPAVASAIGVDLAWLTALVEAVQAWSHMHVLRWGGGKRSGASS